MRTTHIIALFAFMLSSTISFAGEGRGHRGGPGGGMQDSAFKAAFDECISANNLSKPEPGQRPSDEDRATLEACLKEKGFEKPARGPREQQQ